MFQKIFLLLLFPLFIVAQKPGVLQQTAGPVPAEMERELLSLADSVFRNESNIFRADENEKIFASRLQSVLKYPSTFTYPFHHLTTYCREKEDISLELIYSSDARMRFFTWRLPMYDSLIQYKTIFQVVSRNGKVVAASRIPHKEYSKVLYSYLLPHSVRQIYLFIGEGKNPNGFTFSTVEIIEVKDNGITDVTSEFLPFISEAIPLSTLQGAVVIKSQTPRTIFNAPKGVLYYPELYPETGDWTGRILEWQFKGEKFEQVNNLPD